MINTSKDTVIFDTNIILQETTVLEIAVKNDKKILIPLTILMELDKLKYDKNIGYIARGAIRNLKKLYNENKTSFILDTQEVESLLKVIIEFDNYETDEALRNASKRYLLSETNNDFKIIATAIKNNACIITKDISMALIAESQGVEVELLTNVDEVKFDSYLEIDVDSALSTIFSNINKPFQDEYSNKRNKSDFYKIIKNIHAYYSIDVFDTWRFIILSNAENNDYDYIYAINPINEKIVRIDNKNEYNQISNDVFKLKPKDAYQICAIYALKEAPATLLLGKYGSGKSLLATAYALTYTNEMKKVFISRPNIGLDSRYDIGFLPGDKNDKLIEWLAGFLSATYYLYGNTKGQINGQMSFDYVKENIFMNKFEIIPLNMLQGASILEDDIFVIDEIQLINLSYMTMILSRINEGAKLIMCGDYKQSYDVIKPSESGILKLLKLFSLSNDKLKELGIDVDAKKYLAIVNLKKYYRNKLTELADGLNKQLI